MPHNLPLLEVRVEGDLACFSRPELKVERVSYPMMTPSAARGVLEAIFWKPEIAWQVREIHVLRPIEYFSILRNEVNGRASERAATAWQKNDGRGGYDASDDRARAQRHTLALRDVAYVIRAEIVLKPHATDDIAKYRDQFRRRVTQGRAHAQPYLGCREFAADFSEPHPDETALNLTVNFGLMLHDLTYAPDRSGRGTPHFFEARLDRGVLSVPPFAEAQLTEVS